MCRISFSVLILCLSLHSALQNRIKDVESNKPVNEFDILALAQGWPVTVCKIMNPGGDCNIPKKKHQWPVHGIWPLDTKGNYITFCNESWPYDPKQIKSIKGELEQAWTSILKDTDPIYWEHEWLKHGTCATEIEEFNSQFKYFSKGIEWNQKYSILDMFEAAQIFPDDDKEYTPEVFVNAVKAKTKKNPMVLCYEIDGVLYLVEIRLCFDKQQNLIDCNTVVDQSCYLSEVIIFPLNA